MKIVFIFPALIFFSSVSLGQYNGNSSFITIDQNITKEKDEYVVVIYFKNFANISGFAKVLEDIPKNFWADTIQANGASFTFSENNVKFI